MDFAQAVEIHIGELGLLGQDGLLGHEGFDFGSAQHGVLRCSPTYFPGAWGYLESFTFDPEVSGVQSFELAQGVLRLGW